MESEVRVEYGVRVTRSSRDHFGLVGGSWVRGVTVGVTVRSGVRVTEPLWVRGQGHGGVTVGSRGQGSWAHTRVSPSE